MSAEAQSLTEAARREAERRRALQQQGAEGKIVQDVSARAASGGGRGITAPAPPSREGSKRTPSSTSQPSLQPLRTKLRKLDLDIRYGEEQLATLRARMESERWQPPKVGKISRASSSVLTLDRLRVQIEALEGKLKRLRSERFEAYETGRKAGYLPGELDGKGIVP